MIIGLIMISRASETKNLTKAVSNLTFAPKQEANYDKPKYKAVKYFTHHFS